MSEMKLAVALHGGAEVSGQHLAEETLRTAHTAREEGYSAVVAGQHFLTAPRSYLQPLPLLARLVPETGDMRLVCGVLLLPLLNPVQTAEEVATVDALSGGRIVVGAGQGYREVEFAAFGVPRSSRRDAQLRSLDSMIAWWSGERLTDVDAGLAMRTVTQPHPPIWYAAGNHKAFTRALERGYTPFIGPQAPPAQVAALLSGAAPGQPVALRRDVLVTDVVGSQVAERALRDRTRLYREWGYGEAASQPHLVGTAEECRSQMRALAAVGVTDLVIRTNWPGVDHEASLEMLRAVAGPVTT